MKLRSKYALLLPAVFALATGLAGRQVQTHTIKDKTELPEFFQDLSETGDILVTFGDSSALLGGSHRRLFSIINYPDSDALGCLIGWAAREGEGTGGLRAGAPALKLQDKLRWTPYATFEPLPGDESDPRVVFRAEGDFSGPGGEKARFVTFYRFDPESGGIELDSQITNTGEIPLQGFDYTLSGDFGTRYGFSPHDETKYPDLRFRIALRPGLAFAWFDRTPREESQSRILEPGKARKAAFSLLADGDVRRLLNRVYLILGRETVPAEVQFSPASREPAEVTISETAGGRVFYRGFFKGDGLSEIPLPAGFYTVRIHAFPAVVETSLAAAPGADNLCRADNPPAGRVRVRINDRSGRPVPGKATFLGLAGTPSPYFRPDDPIATGRNWERYKNSIFPGTGEAEAELPIGTYLVTASRGPEYGIDRRVVEILKDDNLRLDLTVNREVKADGWISLDPHMHTRLSDGKMGIPARLLSVAAEGLDAAVSADHNQIVDYRPDLREQGLEELLAVITGNEVTVNGMIHYNTFPVAFRPEAPRGGAVDPLSDSATDLFDRSRKADPGTLIQVNHPRSGTLGYFNMFELDPDSAAFARTGLDFSFDLLEIFNGPFRHGGNLASIRDWLHLINRGRFFPLTGSSDSHGIDGAEPGYARTYVRYTGGKGLNLDETGLLRALAAGRSFATNGPLIDLRVEDGAGPGETCAARDGRIEVRIRVRSASWVAADQLNLIVNGRRQAGFPILRSGNEPLDFEKDTELRLNRDAALVVEVLGRRSLYPVMQHRAAGGDPQGAILPYAITNPVFVDVDGNGRFDPPLSEGVRILDFITEKPERKENGR